MASTLDPTIAARVPAALKADVLRVVDLDGEENTTEVINKALRLYADARLAHHGQGGLFTTAHPAAPGTQEPPATAALGYGGHARTDDPPTSKRAARDVKPRIRNQHGRILLAIAEWGHASAGDLLIPSEAKAGRTQGLDHEEVREHANVGQSSVGPRLAELKTHGYLVVIGERKGSLGSAQEIHALTPKGVAAVKAIRDELADDAGRWPR